MANIELTEEQKKLLEGIAPVSRSETIEIEPFEGELPEEISPIFEVCTFSKPQRKVVSRMLMAGPTEMLKVENQEKLFENVRTCVRGWRMLIDVNGQEITYVPEANGEGADKERWETGIGFAVKTRLAKRILSLSGMSDLEKTGLT